MWNLLKIVGAAVVGGGVIGALVKSKVDTAINGEKPKKLPSSKYRIVELPEGMDIEEVNIVGRRKNKKKAEETTDDEE